MVLPHFVQIDPLLGRSRHRTNLRRQIELGRTWTDCLRRNETGVDTTHNFDRPAITFDTLRKVQGVLGGKVHSIQSFTHAVRQRMSFLLANRMETIFLEIT
jgi:hypothetical protein